MIDFVAAVKRGIREASMNFENMKTHEMLAFYNRHSDKPIKRFESRATALRRCNELWNSLRVDDSPKVMNQRVKTSAAKTDRPAMRDSLKLDRRIVIVNNGEVWPNAYRMWCAYPDSMTSAQQDRLTQLLYAGAKLGQRVQVSINDTTYCLFHVNGLADWSAK